jgi:MFS family permease
MANASDASDAGTLGISRWWRVVGGVSMNLALGSLYAWSVFVAPLEKEFKWKRAETSMVFTIAVVVFALTFIVAGRLQDKLGPFKISLAGAILVSLGFFFCAYADSLRGFSSSSACWEDWATVLATRPQFLSCPSGSRTSADWRWGWRWADMAAAQPSLARWPPATDPALWLAHHFPGPGRDLLCYDRVWRVPAEEPPCWLQAGWLGAGTGFQGCGHHL